MPAYIHQHKAWPKFQWSYDRLAVPLATVRHHQGLLVGKMETIGFSLKSEAVLQTLTTDVIKSSEIEGEILNEDQVRSSVARRLGMETGALAPIDRNVEGIVEMMLDATQKFDAPLTQERLFDWHAALFPTGRSGMHRIKVGAWRDDVSGPMQVLSGVMGKERVHYEAPSASKLADEMTSFLAWFNEPAAIDPVLKAAIAHLWFVTIHPFDDGNGRIARAIADMELARSEKSPRRFYSMSAQIRLERKAYYEILESTQKGDLDITTWLEWFLNCLDRAVINTETVLSSVLHKARFWEKLSDHNLTKRQHALLSYLLGGFQGKLTSSKWALLAKCSQDSASRDIGTLVEQNILVKDEAGGRSTSYSLNSAFCR